MLLSPGIIKIIPLPFNISNNLQFLSNLTVTGGSGYNNTDIVTVSNSVINAVANISTNATGSFVNTGITIVNSGLFSNVQTNTALVVTIKAANGAASNGTSAAFVANLTVNTTALHKSPTYNFNGTRILRILNTDTVTALINIFDPVANVQTGSIAMTPGYELTLEKNYWELLSSNNTSFKVLSIPVAYKS